MQSKVLAKIEQIARWRVAGVKDSTIAQKLGMSYGGLTRILQTDFYRQREAEVRRFLMGKMDEVLVEDRTNILKNEMRDAVPEAVKFIIDQVQHGVDMRARMKASIEVLDRDPDGTFSKSRKPGTDISQSTGLPESVIAQARRESAKAEQIVVGSATMPFQKPGEA